MIGFQSSKREFLVGLRRWRHVVLAGVALAYILCLASFLSGQFEIAQSLREAQTASAQIAEALRPICTATRVANPEFRIPVALGQRETEIWCDAREALRDAETNLSASTFLVESLENSMRWALEGKKAPIDPHVAMYVAITGHARGDSGSDEVEYYKAIRRQVVRARRSIDLAENHLALSTKPIDLRAHIESEIARAKAARESAGALLLRLAPIEAYLTDAYDVDIKAIVASIESATAIVK